jgi:hypothetical protein
LLSNLRRAALFVATAAVASSAFAPAPGDSGLARLFRDHDWFELRDAIRQRHAVPLYVGAVAAAFNHVDAAERALREAIRIARDTETSNQARELLLTLFIRNGRTSEASRVIDDVLRVAPEDNDVRNIRAIFSAFRDRPDQRAGPQGRARFSCTVRPNGVTLPMSVNGRSVEWLLDTGANVTAMSESEGQRLGIAVGEAAGRAADSAGGSAPFRSAVAAHVVVAGTELRDVPVILLPDAQPPWSDFAPFRQGAIGLPVAIALQRISWSRQGSCDIGPAAATSASSPANLAFDGFNPVVRVDVGARHADFVLDTGNQGRTQLWERFGRSFPTLMRRGVHGGTTTTGVGGSQQRAVVTLPDLRLRVGGRDVRLQSVNLFSRPMGDGQHAGNLGMEVLGQASSVTIDFRTMSVVLQ